MTLEPDEKPLEPGRDDLTAGIIRSPVPGERFVRGEVVEFRAEVRNDVQLDGSRFRWVSDIDGPLGNGLELAVLGLSTGHHEIRLKPKMRR